MRAPRRTPTSRMKVTYFKSPADFHKWLEAHAATARELWVGYYRKSSGKPSLTWPESVDQALCFGWIDGVRKTVDRSGIYAYEQRPVTLDERYAKRLRQNKTAWAFFQAQPPSYRKVISWWIASAKKEETRLQRLARLIESSAQGRRL
jgi:uncharacterized protein YdeI (YjbR/CyaY-like superfamily)